MFYIASSGFCIYRFYILSKYLIHLYRFLITRFGKFLHLLQPLVHTIHIGKYKFRIDYVYVPLRVAPEGLHAAIDGMRALNIRGLNVTIPHKVAVMSLLDDVDERALKIGAVNTVVNDDSVLKGYNTDATGFLTALQNAGVEP